ncbi:MULTISPECIES: DUF2806 domain-containing protein [Rhizobium]|uniref:DUF2806 domain-containing protein n=1 Tax=Rhizobium phaseoli TaxID=396 RepID=UPI000A20097D|nr:DUF2806 domain-containing protein [Rhizobium phaseoli]
MTEPDHLDKETSVSVSLTTAGVEAKARSRLLSAVDRLGGNIFEFANSFLEAGTSRRRATIEGERALIEATAKWGIERISGDTEFAERAFANHFKKIAAAQINREEVLEAAIEDLCHSPPSSSAAIETETLSGPFLDRLDQYAAEASTEELRERWGRVLAAEVRKPGTFSNKVLRTIDELDAVTAALFEKVCTHRLGNVLPRCLAGQLSFDDQVRLTEAGLLVEPGLGQHREFARTKTTGGDDIWIMVFSDDLVFTFPIETAIPPRSHFLGNGNEPIMQNGEGVGVPVYVLSEVGSAISSILQDNTQAAFSAYCAAISRALPSTTLSQFRREGGNFVFVKTFDPPAQDS